MKLVSLKVLQKIQIDKENLYCTIKSEKLTVINIQ